MLKTILLGILVSQFVFAANILNFRDRQINFDNHFSAYPFQPPFVDAQNGKLIYRDRGDNNKEKILSYDPQKIEMLDQRKGELLSADDFSTRTIFGMMYSKLTQKIYVRVDKHHDESFNIYELDPKTHQEKKISNVGYVFSEAMSEDGKQIAIITRSTKEESSPGGVQILNLETGKQEDVFKDSKEIKMTWAYIKFQPGNKGLLLSYISNSDRNKHNLLYISLEKDTYLKSRVLTDISKTRSVSGLHWLNDKEFMFASNEENFSGVYKGSLDDSKIKLMTPRGSNVKGFTVLKSGDTQNLLTVVGTVLNSDLKVTNLKSGKTVFAKRLEAQVSIEESFENQAVLYTTSISESFRNIVISIDNGKVKMQDLLGYPKDVAEKIVNCIPEKISYRTFDGASAPGEKGKLHAYLLKPKKPLAKPLAMIESFYGGANAFNPDYQMYCEAGIYVLTPAPRGTTNFSQDFENLAKGDFGGGDTLDVIEAGKYLSKRLKIPSEHIGVFGGSRGGYQVLRALTLPEEVNGHKVGFKFGFGISDYGMSNLIRAYEGGNIAGWYEQLTGGDPRKDSAKWLDRSPETHPERLSGPLLLTHGTQDKRVPTIESEAMYEKAKAAGKEVYLVKFEGQGHGFKGNEAMLKYYRAAFEFLEKVK